MLEEYICNEAFFYYPMNWVAIQNILAKMWIVSMTSWLALHSNTEVHVLTLYMDGLILSPNTT